MDRRLSIWLCALHLCHFSTALKHHNLRMLPQNLFQPRRDDEEYRGGSGGGVMRGNSAADGQPPLGVTGVLCQTSVVEIPSRGSLHYTMYRPRNLIQFGIPPLVCIAGGPLLPSHYLSSIVPVVTDRSVILFDAIGCGLSIAAKENKNLTCKSAMADDLAKLIEALPNCTKYHLLGHSFGGLVVVEFLKKQQRECTTPACLSAILVSTPLSIAKSRRDSSALMEQLKDDYPDNAHSVFSELHECRVKPIPLVLQKSLDTVVMRRKQEREKLFQTDDDNNDASKVEDDLTLDNAPPTLILQGEHDFLSLDHSKGWSRLIPNSQSVVLAGCSHYPMVENEHLFGSVVGSFIKEHDVKVDIAAIAKKRAATNTKKKTDVV